MSKSAIYTVNQSSQSVEPTGVVNLGSIVRRYGCNLNLSGNSILVDGVGYYSIDCNVVATIPTAGTLTATLFKNGVAIPGATASADTAADGDVVTLPISIMIRESCSCNDASSITCVLTGVASTVSNISMRVVKD